jgi:hypothetical protein
LAEVIAAAIAPVRECGCNLVTVLVMKLWQNCAFVVRWNKIGPTTTGSILPAAYSTRCAGNIRISSLSCVMHKAICWLATMGIRFRQPQQRQLGEINRHRPRLVAGQQLGR